MEKYTLEEAYALCEQLAILEVETKNLKNVELVMSENTPLYYALVRITEMKLAEEDAKMFKSLKKAIKSLLNDLFKLI